MTEDPEFGFVDRHVSTEFTLVEHPMAPGILGAPTHTHSREDELSYVVYGRVQAEVGDRLISAGPQEIIWKPRGVPHAFWNPGPDRALILELMIPGGLERYFRELVALVHGVTGPPPPELLARLGQIQARYGLEMDGASIPALGQRYHVRMPSL